MLISVIADGPDLELAMSAARSSDNVIALAPYRAARSARRPAMPYVLWYPGVGYVMANQSTTRSRHAQATHGPRSA